MTEHMLVRIGADKKEEWDTGGEFHEPGTPHPPLENMAGSLADILGDATRHDAGFAWIVRSVKPVQAAGDGTVRIGTDWYCAQVYGWLFAALSAVPGAGPVRVFVYEGAARRVSDLFPGAVVHEVKAGSVKGRPAQQDMVIRLAEEAEAADVTVFFTFSASTAGMLRKKGISAWSGR